jgi:acyl-ACP thioesterase
MDKLAIWSESCELRFGAIDKSDTMTLDAALDFFQEAAISHAENLGVGRKAMAQSNQAWILSRMSLQIDRRPAYGETVTIRTWPRGGEKLFALRDYDIRDADDKPAIRARSCWLIIDIEKRRPLRPQSIMDALPQNEGEDALLPDRTLAVSLSERPSLQKIMERKALYNDVDYNGHVNHVSYIQWIEDAIDSSLLEQAKQMRLDINYLNEVLPGDVTGIWSAEIEDTGEIPASGRVFYAAAFEGRKIEALSDSPLVNSAAFRAELRLWH